MMGNANSFLFSNVAETLVSPPQPNAGEEWKSGSGSSMSVQERIELMDKPGDRQTDREESNNTPEDPSEKYFHIVSNSTALADLIRAIKRESLLSRDDCTASQAIRKGILEALPNIKLSSKRAPPNVEAEILVDWDLDNFREIENFEEDTVEMLERCLALTGTVTHAQATTCLDYVRQTWLHNGETIVNLLQEMERTAYGSLSVGVVGTYRRMLLRSKLTGVQESSLTEPLLKSHEIMETCTFGSKETVMQLRTLES